MRIFQNANYNFIKWRWHALIVSVVVIWAGVATIFLRGGLPLGIDFTGGTVVTLEFSQPVGEDAVRAALGPIGSEAVVQRLVSSDASKTDIMVRMPLTPGQQANLDQDAARIVELIRAANLGDFIPLKSDIVGPTVGADLQRKGIWATIASLGGILIYVAFRFRLTFAIGAIVATFHDILITLVLLTWFHY